MQRNANENKKIFDESASVLDARSAACMCVLAEHTHTRNGIVLSEMRAFCFGFSFVYNSVRMNKFTLDIDIPNEYNRFSCVRERNAKKCHFLMLIKAKLV